ncbi:hypothetical protein ACFSKM_27610 [Ancylobacter dichloromethanicus]
MPYESERNQYKPGGLIWGPARDWYTLVSADIGAKELPRYGRALEIDIAPSVELPVILVVVPVGNMDDAETRTLTFRESGAPRARPGRASCRQRSRRRRPTCRRADRRHHGLTGRRVRAWADTGTDWGLGGGAAGRPRLASSRSSPAAAMTARSTPRRRPGSGTPTTCRSTARPA